VHIINIGTFLPKQCGIATFSSDVCSSLTALGHTVDVIAVSDAAYSYVYPPEVRFEIRQGEKVDYLAAAEWIQQQQPDAVLIQHEYGIYGGECGDYILELAEKLTVPYFMVSHTVLTSPTWKQQFVLWRLAQHAQRIIIMNERARCLLETLYGIPGEKIVFIPHGVPVFEKGNANVLKQQYGLEGRKIVSTFGLIGPGKGLELGIRSFAQAAQTRPELCYLILGQTHPMLQKTEGEAYRERLLRLVEELHLQDQVRFINHFLSLKELGDFMYMTDIYFSPYPNLEQNVSGTMAFAIGCGRAIVSTPYAYAAENLRGGKGLISRTVSDTELGALLGLASDDDMLRAELQQRAAALGASWSWPEVGKQYIECFEGAFLHPYLPSKGAYPYYAEL